MQLRLDPITAENWGAAVAIEVADDQRRFLTTPAVADFLADDAAHPTFTSYLICDGATPVGFVSLGHTPLDTAEWSMPLLIIDRVQRRRGYGRAAMEGVIGHVRGALPAPRVLGLLCHRHNVVAQHLYTSLGFAQAGAPEDGDAELKFRLDLFTETST
ncbi:MAG: GNAT family N-acetyltransferase [Dehalococcoidia bacterium]|nr:GNAT family N-acetyltransferase [Dehalococcoidia bacterium]